MERLFSLLLNMSWTGSLVIFFVLLVRVCLRHAPKGISYALWSVVLFRLLCPISLSVEHAPLSVAHLPFQDTSSLTSALTSVPMTPAPIEPVPSLSHSLPPVQTASTMDILGWIWLSGTILMLAMNVVSVLKLRWRLREAIRIETHVYWTDQIEVPFTFGRNIYLPAGLTEENRSYVLMHERQHIRRGDPVWKLLALLALSLHWFNPLCWLAFHLAERDMEMSCDEAVLNTLEHDARVDYSTLLLELASGQKFAAAALPFGEKTPEKRIKNILRWKRPATSVLLLCAVLATVVVVLLAVNPGGTQDRPENSVQIEEASLLSLLRSGEVVAAEGKSLPAFTVIESLLHEVFRNPNLINDVEIDRVWEMSVDLCFPGNPQAESVTLRCGLHHPAVVQLSGQDQFSDTVLVESQSLYELVQSAMNPAFSDDKIPYIDDPDAYGRYYDVVDSLRAMDLGKNGIQTHSTLTHFLAVRTGEHPLGAKVYYVGVYTIADPVQRTAELLTDAAYVDNQNRIYELEPRQCLVTVDDIPIGFVSEEWLHGNDLNYDSQQDLIAAVVAQGLPVSASISD